jgi:hypothetical protein
MYKHIMGNYLVFFLQEVNVRIIESLFKNGECFIRLEFITLNAG